MDWETRKSQRLQISGTVWIQINSSMQDSVQLEKEAVEVEMVDISVHGVGLLSKTFLPKGTLVDLEFPGSALTVPKAAPPPEIVRITAKVMYSRPQGEFCRMGLMITEMNEEARRVIRDFSFSRELRRTPALRFPRKSPLRCLHPMCLAPPGIGFVRPRSERVRRNPWMKYAARPSKLTRPSPGRGEGRG